MAALCWLLQLTPKTLCIKYQFFSLYKHIVHPTPHDVGKTKSGKSLIPVRSAERRSGVNSWENAWVPGFRRTPSMSRKIAKDESCTREEMSREDQTASYCVFQKKEICKVCNLERLKTEGFFHRPSFHLCALYQDAFQSSSMLWINVKKERRCPATMLQRHDSTFDWSCV